MFQMIRDIMPKRSRVQVSITSPTAKLLTSKSTSRSELTTSEAPFLSFARSIFMTVVAATAAKEQDPSNYHSLELGDGHLC